jgi:hypothetical protein
MSLYDGRHPEDVRMPAAFYLPYLGPARHAHFSIMGWVADLFDDARVCGTTVSTDLHDWDGVNPYHKVFALRADLVFLSTAALGERKDTVMRAIVEQGRALAVIAMAGADGAYLLERGSDEVRHFLRATGPARGGHEWRGRLVCGRLPARLAGRRGHRRRHAPRRHCRRVCLRPAWHA